VVVPRPGVPAEVQIGLVGGGDIEGAIVKSGGLGFEGLGRPRRGPSRCRPSREGRRRSSSLAPRATPSWRITAAPSPSPSRIRRSKLMLVSISIWTSCFAAVSSRDVTGAEHKRH
jgi:hypothetical protein